MEQTSRPSNPTEITGAVRGYFVPVFEPDGPRPVTFAELYRAARQRWWWLLVGALAGLGLGIAVAFVLRPVYQGKVMIVAVKDDAVSGGLSNIVGQLGGLASLAGLGVGGDSKRNENVAVLMSRGFTERFIREENLLPVLFASRWDAARGAWKPHWYKPDPTIADAVRKFDRKIRFLSEERRTGVMTLLVEWRDREQAAMWANKLVARANAELRQKAIVESKRNIEYLEREANATSVAAIKASIYRVVETEVRRGMLANVRPDYAFRVLDPAVVPDERDFVRPRRALLAAAGLVAGFLAALALAIGVALQRREG
jgi:uncharacterized protein involved in exopolysaccharide biosynthesis